MTMRGITLPTNGLVQELADWFGDFEDDYDMDAVYADYVTALRERMPDGMSLHWPPSGPVTVYADTAHTREDVVAAFEAAEATLAETGALEDIAMNNRRDGSPAN